MLQADKFRYTLICCCALLTSCFFTKYKSIDPKLLTTPLRTIDFTSTSWPLRAWVPIVKKSDKLRIYIEGDGRAWAQKNLPSADPTPTNNLVVNLLAQDTASDIAYISQPCQYVQQEPCNCDIWTFGRYSNTALESMNQAIEDIKKLHSYDKIELIGYSGGGAMALLLAAHRDDVLTIRTVAGNLAPHFTNKYHNVTSMPDAIDPIIFAKKLSKIPQIHFVGTNDHIIPKDIVDYYLDNMLEHNCIQVITVTASHAKGWVESWSSLLLKQPTCKSAMLE